MNIANQFSEVITQFREGLDEGLISRIKELEAAIQHHYRQSVGQDQCWENDETLWKVLNDGTNRKYPHSLNPDWDEFLIGCIKYCKSRQTKS